VDLCHTTYPVGQHDEAWPSCGWYERTFCTPCRMLLALESEWGTWGKPDKAFVEVMDDACKLAVLRAQAKVVVFASHWQGERRRVPDALERLRACHGDADPWLWLDVPNDPSSPQRTPRDIRYGVIP
jgi:hypothetical protein